jgi:hypothetical protein
VPSIEPELLANINMLNMFIAPLWLGAEAPDFVPPNIRAVAVSTKTGLFPRRSYATCILIHRHNPSLSPVCARPI